MVVRGDNHREVVREEGRCREGPVNLAQDMWDLSRDREQTGGCKL